MTQSTNETSIPVTQLREILKASSDEAITKFLHGYAMGFAADQFIGAMIEPSQRIEFFIAIAKTYPDDWAKACEVLQKGG